jgi:hypothetical protein
LTLLYQQRRWLPGSSYRIAVKGTLKQVNDYCRGQDEIPLAVTNGDIIHGIIYFLSYRYLRFSQAAASANIPLTGSGGTSLSQIATKFASDWWEIGRLCRYDLVHTSCLLLYTHALASHWD